MEKNKLNCVEHNNKKAVLIINKKGYTFGLCKECTKKHIESKVSKSENFAKIGLSEGKKVAEIIVGFVVFAIATLIMLNIF